MILLRHSVIVQDVQNAMPVNSMQSAEGVLLSPIASDAIFLKKKILSVLSAIKLKISFGAILQKMIKYLNYEG